MSLFGVPIDDHFWPSIYPGIVIGIIYGLSARGALNIVLSCLGGILGAIAAFIVLAKMGLEDGLLPLAGLIGTSFMAAWGCVAAARRLRRRAREA